MTLKVKAVDSNNDTITSSGKFVFLYGAEAAAQIIQSTIQTQLGEYQYNKTKGIDYFGNVFLGNPNFQKFEFQVRTQVKALSFVEKITAFEYNLNDSVLEYTMTVKTVYGTTTVSS
jgi:hypothetical protein